MKAMKHIFSLCCIALAVLALSGCRTMVVQPVKNYAYAADSATVERAIIDGCRDRGWSPRKVRDGEIEATINVRIHTAVVTILYNADGYEILYKDSNNLHYDPQTKEVHSNYVAWVRNLDRSISKRLLKPAATPTGSGS